MKFDQVNPPLSELAQRAALGASMSLFEWKTSGGPRPARRPDGISSRIDRLWMTVAELAITHAMMQVEKAGASVALTDAVVLLAKARDRVADHVEGIESVKSGES